MRRRSEGPREGQAKAGEGPPFGRVRTRTYPRMSDANTTNEGAASPGPCSPSHPSRACAGAVPQTTSLFAEAQPLALLLPHQPPHRASAAAAAGRNEQVRRPRAWPSVTCGETEQDEGRARSRASNSNVLRNRHPPLLPSLPISLSSADPIDTLRDTQTSSIPNVLRCNLRPGRALRALRAAAVFLVSRAFAIGRRGAGTLLLVITYARKRPSFRRIRS